MKWRSRRDVWPTVFDLTHDDNNDHQVGEILDFGDALNGPYPTLLINNGARHLVDKTLRLGRRIDAEADGLSSRRALGDDRDNQDDEDGVIFTSSLTPGAAATVDVFCRMPPGTTARLDAWIDFNRDGDWGTPGDQIFNSQPVTHGLNALTFTVPAGASPTATFARFRLSRAGGLDFKGLV